MRKEIICLLAAGVVLWAGQSLYAHPDHCYSCHIPHNALSPVSNPGAPLWNPQRVPTKITTFTMYTSPTFANLNPTVSAQPDGASRLCLGCHDGSGVHSSSDTFGPDLGNMHPISFQYTSTLATNSKGQLKDPSSLSNLPGGGTIATDLLDGNGEVQCTTCHDIHATPGGNFTSGTLGNFYLRYAWDPTATPPTDNVMCRTCHSK